MKLVTAIIKPFKLEEVKDALARIGVEGMTALEVSGVPHRTEYGRAEFGPRIQIQIAIEDAHVHDVCETITREKTGKRGDGILFVTHLKSLKRVREDF